MATFIETAPNEDPDQDGLSLHYSQRFPSQTYDAETGLHYNFHRDYNPQTGRYVQSDPIGLGGGMNSFAYVGGSPAAAWDILGYAPTYIKGNLNRTIDISLDAHNASEINNAISLIKKFSKIKFAVYIYSRDKNSSTDLKNGGARVVGLHINPVDTSAGSLTSQINSFYGNSSGLPVSIHGSATTRLPTSAMSSLKNKKAPFVRAAGDSGSTGGTPPVVLSFSGGHTLTTIQKNTAISHFFAHPNAETNPGTNAYSVLDYFNRNAQ